MTRTSLSALLLLLLSAMPTGAQTSWEELDHQDWEEYKYRMRTAPLNKEEQEEDSSASESTGSNLLIGLAAGIAIWYAWYTSQKQSSLRHQDTLGAGDDDFLQDDQKMMPIIIDFLNDYYNTSKTSMGDIGRFYAAMVNYADRPLVSKQEIVSEKMEVTKVCPFRDYSIEKSSIRYSKNDAIPGVYNVYYEVLTQCSGGLRETSRLWMHHVGLRMRGGSPIIVANRQRVKAARAD